MKGTIRVFVLFAVLLCYVFCVSSFAEEKKQGFIKRTWRRITGSPAADVKEAEKEEVVEVEEVPGEVPVEEVEGAPGEVPEEVPEGRPMPPLEKAEILERLKWNLDTYQDEVASRVKNIVKGLDRDGNEIYLFKKETGERVAFEDLDKETLFDVYITVANQVVVIQQERLAHQLELLNRQAEQLRNIEAVQRQLQSVQPPAIYQPPVVPQQPPEVHTPPSVPSQPNVPSPPPSPPSLPSPPQGKR